MFVVLQISAVQSSDFMQIITQIQLKWSVGVFNITQWFP